MKIPSADIKINAGNAILTGSLTIPSNSKVLVIFSHGSGSSRFSPRNRYVADVLNVAGISTLMVDLLTEKEDEVYENRFNIPLLTRRLVAVTNFLILQDPSQFDSIGFFGASTGAASALMAAAEVPDNISAVVSRGGRPDLAFDALPEVKAPTLLIVGGLDDQVIALNKLAFSLLKCEKEIKIIPGATHLFEEPGTLENVADLACAWFIKHFHVKK